MKMFEAGPNGTLADIGAAVGIAKTTGGRALVSAPIISDDHMDIFANNEGYQSADRSNFLFSNRGDGTFEDIAASAGLRDMQNTGRGTALLDADGDGLLDIV